jgi:hypothetical protein
MSGRAKWATLGVAWTAYAVSWFLPVLKLKHSGLLSDLDHGWKAFMVVLTLAIKPETLDWFWGLCIASVLSNLLVLVSPLIFRHNSVPRWYISLMIGGFAVNLIWLLLTSDSTLLAGYWLWVGSMGVLTVAAVANRRRPVVIIRKHTYASD